MVSAAYFCCAEVVHVASGPLQVELRTVGWLELRVVGLPAGSEVPGARDRAEAAGGTLTWEGDALVIEGQVEATESRYGATPGKVA